MGKRERIQSESPYNRLWKHDFGEEMLFSDDETKEDFSVNGFAMS